MNDPIPMGRIPALAVGILLFLGAGRGPADAAGRPELALSLFEEGRWAAAERESRRAVLADEGNAWAGYLQAASSLRTLMARNLGADAPEAAPALARLRALARADRRDDLPALAAYEAGRWHWYAGGPTNALRLLRHAFSRAQDHELFLRAGAALDQLVREHGRDLSGAGDLVGLRAQLNTCRPLWSGEVFAASAVEPAGDAGGPASRPGRWIVAFYRAQISPAIGSRCTLHPSCSEYYRRASEKHGWLAAAMIGDRLVREPGVNARAARPVQVHGHIRFADPMSDHDWWMKRGAE